MENLKLFLSCFQGMPPGCECYVERDESGQVGYVEGQYCREVNRAHKAAVERASERLNSITNQERAKP